MAQRAGRRIALAGHLPEAARGGARLEEAAGAMRAEGWAAATLQLDAATYTVKSGDTLYSIAKRHGTTDKKLMAANGISDPRKLRVGQRLTLSSSGKSSSSSTSRTSSVGRGKRVIIDAGHGGRDKGAIWGGVRESDLNMRVANKLEYLLKRNGYSTTMTRRSDVFISLSRRAAIANQYRNAIFVSIHFNATRETWVRGAETFYAGSRGRIRLRKVS